MLSLSLEVVLFFMKVRVLFENPDQERRRELLKKKLL
jgi:hypothetical protein